MTKHLLLTWLDVPIKKNIWKINSRFLSRHNINLNHVFFDAIDGNNPVQLSKYNYKIPGWHDPSSNKAMTCGEVGCALSHYLVWCEILQLVESKKLTESSKILIVEDDIIFPDNFANELKTCMSEINVQYDMLYIHRKPLALDTEIKISAHIHIPNKSYWLCSYVLTWSGAKKLVSGKYLDNLIPVDEFVPIMYGCRVFGYENLFSQCQKIDCLAVVPGLVRLKSDAFLCSETYHSMPYLQNYSDKNVLLLYTGPTKNDPYDRFTKYCKIYGIDNDIIETTIANTNTNTNITHFLDNEYTSKLINTTIHYFSAWTDTKLASTLIIFIAASDSCHIIPQVSPSIIIDKFEECADRDQVLSMYRRNKFICCAWGDKLIDRFKLCSKLPIKKCSLLNWQA